MTDWKPGDRVHARFAGCLELDGNGNPVVFEVAAVPEPSETRVGLRTAGGFTCTTKPENLSPADQ